MDLSLIALLGGCLMTAALLYYVIFVRREQPISSWGKSGIVTLMFVLVPVLVIALWFQDGAVNRLEQMGFEPYPGFVSCSGIATGLGEKPFGYLPSRVVQNRFWSFTNSLKIAKAGCLFRKASLCCCLSERGSRLLYLR